MSGPTISPCLWFDDAAEAAAALYTAAFPDGAVTAVARYPADAANPGGRPPGSVMTVAFTLAGLRMVALNGGPRFAPTAAISMFVQVATLDACDQLAAALGDGGQVRMPLGAYPWSARYGWLVDRFGVSWQIMVGGAERVTIAPCLMFAGAAHGQAEAALRRYAEVFPGGGVTAIERYQDGEGPRGAVKHGRASLAGQPLIAMDSHDAPGAGFTAGVSLQVACADQAQLDDLWTALRDGGQPGACGWLTDRFGVSWQVVPQPLERWLSADDVAARDRVFQAVLGMGKLDVGALARALAG